MMPTAISAQTVELCLIVAMSQNRVIGRDNKLPWHLPEDLRRFKALTMGSPVIMGRLTWESLPFELPYRKNIILTKTGRLRPAAGPKPNVALPKAQRYACVASIGEAIAIAQAAINPNPQQPTLDGGLDRIFFIGGATVYAQALPLVHRLYITQINEDIEGDTYFPAFNAEHWHEQKREEHTRADGLSFSFIDLVRVADA